MGGWIGSSILSTSVCRFFSDAPCMVERSNLFRNVNVHVQIQTSSCLLASKIKIHFACMHFVALTSKSKSKKKCFAYVNKNDPVPLSQGAELFWRATLGSWRGAIFAGAASLFLLSLLSFLNSFSFLSLPPPFSQFCFQKPIWERTRRTAVMRMVRGGHLGSLRGLWARVRHFDCAQKQQNRSPGEAKAKMQKQKPKKPVVSRKPRNFRKYMSIVSNYIKIIFVYLW